MSMFDPAPDRFQEGMSTERYHDWHGNGLDPEPVRGVDGIAGCVTITMRGPDGNGVVKEQCEPVGANWHQSRAGKNLPARWVRKS